MPNSQSEGSKELRIIRGHLDSLSLYEITDHELDVLEEGSFGATFLNFAIALFSISLTFFITLCTVTIPEGKVFTVFVLITIVGFVASTVLFVLWYKTRSRIKLLIVKIKARCPTSPAIEGQVTSSTLDTVATQSQSATNS